MSDAKAIDLLSHQLQGRLVRPKDAGYDEARRVWNGMIDKRPPLDFADFLTNLKEVSIRLR